MAIRTATMAATPQRKPRALIRILLTLLYPSLIFLPFIPEAYVPIESPVQRYTLRIATCFVLMTLASKTSRHIPYRAISTTVEVVALLGVLFLPPSDAPFNETAFPPSEERFEPYMMLNEWIGSPGDGWVLSMVSSMLAYVVHVVWRVVIREKASYPGVRWVAYPFKARDGKKITTSPYQPRPSQTTLSSVCGPHRSTSNPAVAKANPDSER
ncbi:hypothetical protein FPV67DRAFT_5497 [Lyophyllum atratum]|nr:hypothetical protein FPV67DRAFT_5497 [Lyophyllum atratum]